MEVQTLLILGVTLDSNLTFEALSVKFVEGSQESGCRAPCRKFI